MSLSRKMLKAMGIEDEKIDEIIDAHAETVDALKKERDNYKADAEKLPELRKNLEKMTKEREENDGKDPWKVKYDALKEEYGQYKDGIEAEKTKAEKTKAFRDFLKGIGVADKRLDAVVRVSDIEKLEIEDGKVKDADGALAKQLKEEWADFIVKESEKTTPPDHPPKGSGGKMTKQQILEIKDSAERQKAIAENHELFGF